MTLEEKCPFERIRGYPDCYEDCPDTEVCPMKQEAQLAKVPDREKIAKYLYDNFNTISKGCWEQLPQFNETRQWWLITADYILTPFPLYSDEELDRILDCEVTIDEQVITHRLDEWNCHTGQMRPDDIAKLKSQIITLFGNRIESAKEAGKILGVQSVIDYLKNEIATVEERSAGEPKLKAHLNAVEKVILQTVVNALEEWQSQKKKWGL